MLHALQAEGSCNAEKPRYRAQQRQQAAQERAVIRKSRLTEDPPQAEGSCNAEKSRYRLQQRQQAAQE
ncbi:hypothetical protein DVH26_26605 [Paenibacillus sp. H1-7]|nr:hypothetical protein DVH26_26605 [Paenibacillus sp. H1-7]